jgi:tetratricopeptide (TPR) repeat protein
MNPTRPAWINFAGTAALLALFLTSPLLAQPASWPAEREERAKKATEQRLAYAASADYHPYDSKNRDFQKSVNDLLDQGKFPEAIAEAQKGLAVARHDIDLLVLLAAAYRESGDIANADKTREQWMALVDSILRSGTGRDFATAFQVISVAEEYAVMRVLGLQPGDQSLVAHEGSEFDVVTAKNRRTGAELVLYFNVDLPKKWLNKQFSEPKK